MRKYFDAVRTAASLLPQGDKYKVFRVAVLQVFLSFLDLVGVALIGVIGALSVTLIQNGTPGDKTSSVLLVLKLDQLSLQSQILVLSSFSLLTLIGRTIFSVYFTKRYLLFLGNRSAYISSTLYKKLIAQELTGIQKQNKQETIFILTEGVRRITIGILGNFVFLVSDLALLIVLTSGLAYIDPLVASVTLILFGSIAIFLHLNMSQVSRKLGKINSEKSILSNLLISESLETYRESLVRNRRIYYARTFENQRTELARIEARLSFMPMISKYVLESAVIVGAFLIAGLQFALNDSRHAIATLTIFLAAGSRIGPAIMRVQQGMIQIGIAIGSAAPTFNLIREINEKPELPPSDDLFTQSHIGFIPEVLINNLSFKYPESENTGVSGINLLLEPGKKIAIVGSSGSGKTTLVDLIIGVHRPITGAIKISGLNPLDAINKWPGAIAYVPQDVALIEGSIRENICLGYPRNSVDDSLILEAIEGASLSQFLSSLEKGLDTQIGELGSKISGGERQRIGIARSLLTKPQLLVLDEATSALDGSTEAEISESLLGSRSASTVIMIAHRLSTIKNADVVIYLEDGHIVAKGTFEEIRKEVPHFETQASLMGL